MAGACAPETTCKRYQAMINGEAGEIDTRGLIRKPARLLVEEALGGEVAEALVQTATSTARRSVAGSLAAPGNWPPPQASGRPRCS